MAINDNRGYVEDRIRGMLAGWMNDIIKEKNLRFEYVDVQVPRKRKGKSTLYADILIWNKKDIRPAFLIELKLLDWSPYDPELIDNAKEKCVNSYPQIEYYGTWNINELVLWKTFDKEATSYMDNRQARYEITNITNPDHINNLYFQQQIKQNLEVVLKELEAIYYEKKERLILRKLPVDEFFIYALHSAVKAFYPSISNYLYQVYREDREFSKKLNKWAVEQGWLPPSIDRINDFERVSRQFLYLVLDKVLFYNTLRISFSALNSIELPKNIKKWSEFRNHIQKYFNLAVKESGDYETIFSENFIEGLPLPDFIIPGLSHFINSFSKYDLSKLEYKDIGRIYDSLIPAEERHNLGQYFTRDDVVDLILGFCIKNKDQKVADFGCGAGTFLVRSYARLKNLENKKKHDELLKQIWGVDIAKFPAHLSMINLARRDLSDIQNYPRIIHKDFFDIRHGNKYIFGPTVHKIRKLDKIYEKEEIPLFDAVVGNPPYIRQEKLEDVIPEYKNKLQDVLKGDWEADRFEIGERADIYVHFFFHGLKFLKEKGRFGYVVSSSWLDVDYGTYLQEFLLKKTKIIAIIESKVEMWFPDASINTCIVILERCGNEEERNNNLIKFVQLKVPLSKLIPLETKETEEIRWKTVEKFIEKVNKTNNFYEDNELRLYPKIQKELWEEGYGNEEKQYVGSKWGKYLRAPDIFFKILDKGKNKFISLKKIADVRFGIKTGANEFFHLNEEQIKKWKIEKEFFQPVISSLKEVAGYKLCKQNLKNKIIICSKIKKELKNTNMLKYINWGEEQGFQDRPTCASRDPWYNIGENWHYAPIIFPAKVGERMPVFLNDNVFEDKKLYGVTPKRNIKIMLLAAYLNSTITRFFIEFSCRQLTGAQAIADIDVNVVEDLPIFNFDKISVSIKNKLIKKFEAFAKTEAGSVFKEIASSPEKISLDKIKADRRELDKIIMGDILGLSEGEQLKVYKAIVDLVKSRIEKAQSVKGEKKDGAISITGLAKSLLEHLEVSKLRFPKGYLNEKTEGREILLPKGIAEVKADLHGFFVEVNGEKIRCNSQDEAKFVFYSVINRRDKIILPKNKDILKKAVNEYSNEFGNFNKMLKQTLESSVPDKKLRRKVAVEIWRIIFEE